MAKTRKIVVHLPADLGDEEHAELANMIWAIGPGGSGVEIAAPDVDAVHAEMDRQWKEAPELRDGRWVSPRRASKV